MEVRTIATRSRDRIDMSKVNIVQVTIRNSCMDANLKMVNRSSASSHSDSCGHDDARELNAAQMRLLGISLYKNSILAPFATRLCVRCTPSVQVMSQAVPMCAIDVLDRKMNKIQGTHATRILSGTSTLLSSG